MYDLYETIQNECKKRKLSVSRMCVDIGLSKSTLSSLKNGITKSLSAPTLAAIADYLGVTVDYLLGKEKTPSDGEREISESDIQAAFFGGYDGLTEEERDVMWKEAKSFIAWKMEERKRKKN